jgi:hypothetical protein
MSPSSRHIARFSLIAVWLLTALVSVMDVNGISHQLLQANALIPARWHLWIIWGGAAVDLLLGLLMAFKHSRLIYLSALLMTVLMTIVASCVDPALWLHPLGPISKNLPIIALLWLLAKDA